MAFNILGLWIACIDIKKLSTTLPQKLNLFSLVAVKGQEFQILKTLATIF
jgi:hypothetical protein